MGNAPRHGAVEIKKVDGSTVTAAETGKRNDVAAATHQVTIVLSQRGMMR
jgi:hypothetical protein